MDEYEEGMTKEQRAKRRADLKEGEEVYLLLMQDPKFTHEEARRISEMWAPWPKRRAKAAVA